MEFRFKKNLASNRDYGWDHVIKMEILIKIKQYLIKYILFQHDYN